MLELNDSKSQQSPQTRLNHQARIIKYALGFSAVLGWALSLVLLTSSSTNVLHTDHLSPELSYNHARYTVWFHSEGKIRELRSILSQHDIHNSKEVAKIKSLIESMLIRRTEVYAQELNKLHTPLESLGNYYLTVFQFEPFLDEVIDICLSEGQDLDSKMISVYETMFVYQTEANTLLKQALLDAENNEGLLL
ncbi:hypothetical protein L4D09_00180 [Photobacterium makurazakiensis]|uniref:hypothetical protein n=1 Tax=Photobacterium makurazakiensis TaxID=2910234 RepID=UPI003D12E808